MNRPKGIRVGRRRPRSEQSGTLQQNDPQKQTSNTQTSNTQTSNIQTAIPEVLQQEARDLLLLQVLVILSGVPIVDLPEKFGLQKLVPRDRLYEDEGVPYALGSGASCTVVQHETGDEADHVVPKGTVVALKIYRRVRRYHDITKDQTKIVVDAIWRDLRVLRHPYLSQHENFVKLLFFGWEPYNIVPIISLELADFGTLKDALVSEFELSWLQKCNIAVDVVVGLHALHECGFIHGDIKPSNIMLQSHQHRQIVAKLMDFSGSADMANFGTMRHRRFLTKLWAAPENLGLIPVTDNKEAADVYALGLLLAQMWPKEEFKFLELESFLEHEIPRNLHGRQKETMLLYYKALPYEDDQSVLNQALRWTNVHSRDPKSAGDSIVLQDILSDCLTLHVASRKSIPEILKRLEPFVTATHRELHSAIDRNECIRLEGELWGKMPKFATFVNCPEFQCRSFLHQSLVLEYMKACTSPVCYDNSPLWLGQASDYETYESVLKLLVRNLMIEPRENPVQFYEKLIHYQIALCYLLGHGAIVDEKQALSYLASAAMGMIPRAMYSYAAVEESCSDPLPVELPRKLFLAMGYIEGLIESGDILQLKHRNFFALAHKAKCHLSFWEIDNSGKLDNLSELSLLDELQNYLPYITILPKLVAQCPPGDLLNDIFLTSIALGLQDEVEQCLFRGADIKIVDSLGRTPMHLACLAPDAKGTRIARLLLDAGADLSTLVEEEVESHSNYFYCGRYHPLDWAIAKNRIGVFSTILEWCSENSLGLPNRGSLPNVKEDSDKKGSTEISAEKNTFRHIVVHRRPEFLNPYLKFLSDRGDMDKLGGHDLSLLLRLAVEETDNTTFSQRWMHGSNFRQSRRDLVEWLLYQGADPLKYQDSPDYPVERTPLKFAIKEGDATCVEVILCHLQYQSYDVDHLLGNMGLFRHGISQEICWSALVASTLPAQTEAFYYLLTRYPQLIDQRSVLQTCPLSRSAELGNLLAVQTLLSNGADCITPRTLKPHATPLTLALINGHYPVARYLLETQDKKSLLFPSPGLSVFGNVLQTYCSGRRHVELEAFQILYDARGFTYLIDDEETAFRALLVRGRPVLHEDVAHNMEILQMLTKKDVFGDKLNEKDWTGRTPLHYAAYYCYPEAVELFLRHGADVNSICGFSIDYLSVNAERKNYTAVVQMVKSGDVHLSFHDVGPTGTPEESFLAKTAIDLTLMASRRTPEIVLAGGASEIKAWQVQLKRVQDLLIRNGGDVGHSGLGNFMELQKLKDHRGLRHFRINHYHAPERGDETWRGQWPKRIPPCPSLTVDPNRGIPTWPKDQAMPLEDQKNQKIVLRSSKGKKQYTSPSFLDVWGTMASSSSEDENDEDQNAAREELQYAQAFVNLRLQAP